MKKLGRANVLAALLVIRSELPPLSKRTNEDADDCERCRNDALLSCQPLFEALEAAPH
jgi:hypothetical protein